MKILTEILVIMTALEFCFIFYLETIATSSKKTADVFNMEEDELKRKSVNTLFKNQGVYNLVIGIFLLVSLLILHSKESVMLFLINIIIVAAYGGISSNPGIFLKQGGLAIISLILLFCIGI